MSRLKCLLFLSVALNILLIFNGLIFLTGNGTEKISNKLLFNRIAEQKRLDTVETAELPWKLGATDVPTWAYNGTAASRFRAELEKCCHGSRDFLVTQTNMRVNTTIQYDAEGKSRLNVTREIWNRFLEETPFQYKKYGSCSVVGNGGLLKESRCGKEIDATDFVFRCNLAPIDARFVEDVGNKTNLVTINPSIVKLRYKKLKNAPMKSKFVEDMSTYGDALVWMPAFSFKMCTSLSFGVQNTLQNYTSKLTTVFGNPNFMLGMNKFWKSKGIKARRISTGLFLASAALSICEKVHLYGFWPYHVDRNNNTLTEHYYDNTPPHKMHKLPEEFGKLRQLHYQGILQLRTDACR